MQGMAPSGDGAVSQGISSATGGSRKMITSGSMGPGLSSGGMGPSPPMLPGNSAAPQKR
jgi:hypothetical protein